MRPTDTSQNDLAKRNIIQNELIMMGLVPMVFAKVKAINKGRGIGILGGIGITITLRVTGRKLEVRVRSW